MSQQVKGLEEFKKPTSHAALITDAKTMKVHGLYFIQEIKSLYYYWLITYYQGVL